MFDAASQLRRDVSMKRANLPVSVWKLVYKGRSGRRLVSGRHGGSEKRALRLTPYPIIGSYMLQRSAAVRQMPLYLTLPYRCL